MMRLLLSVACAQILFADSPPITDEGTRQVVLQTIFPHMPVSTKRGRRIDLSWPAVAPGEPLTDALKDETVYRVVGTASGQDELCVSYVSDPDKHSNTRQVRLKIFPWPREAAGVLAVIEYDFVGAERNQCQTVNFLVHVTGEGG